jgi:SAM-dependent methyltransferase
VRKLNIVLVGLLVIGGQAFSQDAAQSPTAGEQWDKRFDRSMYLYGTEPVEFLRAQIGNLPKGKALCLASGEGRNAVYLAQQGYDVVAMDASPVGLEKATALAARNNVTIGTEVGDLQHGYDMGEEQYDLITDFYYHDTAMLDDVMRALKPGGMFILQNFSIAQLETNKFGPKNPDYLVKPNELLTMFAGHRIIYYEDTVVELDEGMHQGPGAVIRLIVQKNSTD